MTYYHSSYKTYEFTAYEEADLLSGGDNNLGCGDTFTMPASSTVCISVTDNDRYLSGDKCHNENSDDKYGQQASIMGDAGELGNGGQIYAEQYFWVKDSAGNWYMLIEIEQEGSCDDYFTFHTAYGMPPAGAELTVHSKCNVKSEWIDYKCLDAGEKEATGTISGTVFCDEDCDGINGNVEVVPGEDYTIEAEDMWQYGFKTVSGSQASGCKLVKLNCKEGDGTLKSTFNGKTGTYDVKIRVQDENDGQSMIKLIVGGQFVEAVRLDGDNNGGGSNNGGFSTYVIKDVDIDHGEQIKIAAWGDGGEFVRIDKIDLEGEDTTIYTPEPTKAGVTIKLIDAAGAVAATTVTDANGNYSFEDVPVGDYKIMGVAPDGTEFTIKDAGSDDSIDSDVDENGMSDTVTVTADGVVDVDLGVCDVKTGSIEGRYFCDENDNDRDDAEPGIAGAKVWLMAAGTTNTADAVAMTTTGPDGNYIFDDVEAGDYYVRFEDPATAADGKVFVAADEGDDIDDSDVTVVAGDGDTDVFTLAPEEAKKNVDAGVEDPGTAAIKGRYFCDENDDDIDNGEPGISGALVDLLDAAGSVVRTTTTGNDGSYEFLGLDAGTYSVRFAPDASGKTFVAKDDPDGNGDDTNDSDVGPNGVTDPIVLEIGEIVEDVDAGVEDPGTASIGDTVWFDADKDGLLNNGETGVDGVEVKLLADTDGDGDLDDVVATTTTANGGQYLFDDLDAGDYKVMFGTSGDLVFTTAGAAADDAVDGDSDAGAGGMTETITLDIGEAERDIDAGLIDPGTAEIRGRLFCDDDFDDVDDAGNLEPGVSGATVQLLNAAGAVVDTATTGTDGSYAFTGLDAGDYSVVFPTSVDGKVLVAQNAGTDDTIDSDADPVTGETGTITLAIGEVSDDNDAGIVDPQTASLGDKVWLDLNGNGQQDTGEAGVDGVQVTLLDKDGNTVQTQTTSNGGMYLFTGLAAGSYSVAFAEPMDYDFTQQDQGDDASDSDADPISGVTDTIVLAIGEQNLTVDAGIKSQDPNANDDAVMTCADEEVKVDVLSNDFDAPDEILTITHVDGQAIAEGETIITSAGTEVMLMGGQLNIDGEAAYAALDIGQQAVEAITYTVSDGLGGSATATLSATFCGDANSVASLVASLPSNATYELDYAFDGPTPYEAYAFDIRFLNTGDARLDGIWIEEAYCLDFNTAVNTIANSSTPNSGEIFGPQSAAALGAFDPNTVSTANGLSGSENLDLINWVIAQDFEDNGFSGWAVQIAVWELADNFDASLVNFNDIQDTTLADVQSIVNGALALTDSSVAGVDSFVPSVGDTIGIIVDPTSAQDPANVQPFIVSLNWEDYDCLC